MLNPFAIEKDILNKTAEIRKTLQTIKTGIARKVIAKANFYNFQCQSYLSQTNTNPKQYICKICNKSFDDGRRLGGHVSRAHKDMENELEVESDSSEEVVQQPYRNLRRKNGEELISLMGMRGERKSTIFGEKKHQQIFYEDNDRL